MRFLHTSDWHLGRSFHREDLLGAQAAFVDTLVGLARSERADCVIVAGDVYDRALPPVDAVRLCDEALRRLREHSRVVVISGNHDSARRLGFAADLIDAAGVHVRTDPAAVGTPVMVADTAVYPVPYLEPELVRAPWDLPERGHPAALGEAMRRVRADLAALPAGTPSVVVAHAFVTGGEPSASERDISVGGAQHVPAGLFEGVSYAALGHLHGRQAITPAVRYSGSPLAYSFSEEHQVKGCWVVEASGDGARAEFAETPVPRRIARLRGTLADLLADPRYDRFEDRWLQVTLTDPVPPAGAMERLRRRFPHALLLGFAPEGGGPVPGTASDATAAGPSPLEVAGDFVREVTGEPPDAAQRALLDEAFQQVRAREAAR